LQGQRVTYDAQLIKTLVLFESIVPGVAVASCENANGVGFNFLLDAFTGAAQLGGPTLDTNRDGVFNSFDNAGAVIYQTNADGGDAILARRGGTSTSVQDSTGGTDVNAGANAVKRSWRQLFAPPN
jgi:hypothetical protein